MKKINEKYKNLIFKILKSIFFVLSILFIIIHSISVMIICSYGVTYIILLCIFLFYFIQIFNITCIQSRIRKILCSIFLTIILLWMSYILIFEGLLLILINPRVTIDSYKISNNDYLRTISYNSDEISSDVIVDIIYEHEFIFGITCYTPIDSYYKEPDYSLSKIEKFNYVKKKINLKKIYSKINKKPSLCGTNLRNINIQK